MKPATYRGYEGIIRNHLVPYFGNVRISRITREMIQRFVAEDALGVDASPALWGHSGATVSLTEETASEA